MTGARTGTGVVGVLGGSGVVGRAAARALRELGVERLRLGGRRLDAVAAVAAALPGGTDRASRAVAVDLDAAASLAAFCAGCSVVLNCAGPSYRVRGRVALAALAAGAHCVDVAGDDPAYEQLRAVDVAGTGRSVVLSAGMLPGLSGLLPRWLAQRQQVGGGGRLTVWTGGLERCSRTVAADLLLSVGGDPSGDPSGHPTDATVPFGESLAAWRQGRRVSRALRAQDGAELPYFPTSVSLQPYLSTEAERLARALGLDELDWFNVFPGRRVRDLLAALGTGREPLAEAAERLVRAAELDLTGRRPYFRMVFALDSPDGAATAVLGTRDSYRLTAAVGALAVTATLAGTIPAGLHFAAEVLDPAESVRRLAATPGVTLDLSHGPVELTSSVGAL
ncbi:saccharopine dehydrogenase NADP-binding domain-containing protein [Kitasatospora mediocidica]|uniref:saccharopine dehydrogenase NADP-binding domain-containing protein n=1 Tax=Kitasatospora mediocidica TaxID=58352 RepID=UPI000690D1CC|nr:saccharopine dehydrogenase NADP-binding domain-containing protein [Kitasatospora mediocidica]